MKVIHVVEGLDESYGGPAQSIPFLAHHCMNYGVDSILLSTRYTSSDKNDVISKYNLKWEVFDTIGPEKLRYSPGLACRLDELCSADAGDIVVHVHNLWNYTSYAAYKVCKKYKLPLFISPRGSLFPWSLSQGRIRKKFAWNLFQKKMLLASSIHTTSQDEVEAVSNLHVGNRLICIRNGVELNTDQGLISKNHDIFNKLSLDSSRQYALFMSRLHRKKGLEILLDAWAQCEQRTNWTLLIAGSTTDSKYLKRLELKTKVLKLTDSVKFMGFADSTKKAELFEVANFFVLPSYTENFGIVIAEALTKSLPVITTTGTPWAELNSNSAGWHINLDVTELSNTLDAAMSLSAPELEQMGRNAFQLATNYSWDKIGLEMVDAYQRALQAPNHP
jgi:glycosyltransferase involved in cell wall biosynthesis